VTLFEAEGRLGGHAHTHDIGGGIRVDTGFIVCNDRTYPLLMRLFAELDVPTRPAEMSMSVRCAGCGLEYAGKRGLGGLAAGVPKGGAKYLRMLAEIPRFHRAAREALNALEAPETDIDKGTLGQFLTDGGYSSYFTAHFAIPLVAAVWSCPAGTALSYPASYLFRFLANHGMLSVSGSPQWRTVAGGSRTYVDRIASRLAEVRTDTPVREVRRHPDGVRVNGDDFDAVVIATHPDQALRLLGDPTPAEKEVLGAFRYTPNPALLHTDARLLPANRRVSASWNYELGTCAGRGARISYDMNRLQGLSASRYIVTLNGQAAVDRAAVIGSMEYAHPAYTPESVAAQRRLPQLNTAVTAYAGAYHGWGFHEDGCRSGVAAAKALGCTW
jgi:predicted NAD/FAD-binding protein